MNDKPSTVAAAQYLIDTAKASGKHKIDSVIKHDVDIPRSSVSLNGSLRR
jgi:hypothetical protein